MANLHMYVTLLHYMDYLSRIGVKVSVSGRPSNIVLAAGTGYVGCFVSRLFYLPILLHLSMENEGLDSAGIKYSLAIAAARVRSPLSACGRVLVVHSRSVVVFGYYGFFRHVRLNIRAYESVSISSTSFVCDRCKINSVLTYLGRRLDITTLWLIGSINHN